MPNIKAFAVHVSQWLAGQIPVQLITMIFMSLILYKNIKKLCTVLSPYDNTILWESYKILKKYIDCSFM